MKTQILGLSLFITLLSSCSNNESQKSADEMLIGTPADYFINVNQRVDGFVVNTDNNVYIVGQNLTSADSDRLINLKKIEPTGKVTVVNKFANNDFFINKLSNTENGDILLATNDSQIGNKIYRFENNFSELNSFYTMKPTSSPFATPIRLFEICNNGDGSYFVFDSSTRSIKRVVPSLNTDILVAGSGKAEIKDGTTLEASFEYIHQMISNKGILYIIDGGNAPGDNKAIRKVEYTPSGWKATTLLSSTTDYYKNIAFDAQNNLYVLINQKGILKLNLQDNTLSTYRDDRLKVTYNNAYTFVDFKYIDFMYIKNNDLYVQQFNQDLIKISDFQTKLGSK